MLGTVSIVIPVFNGGRYVGSAIESALRQTYSDVEVLVVNDGSTDGETERVCAGFGGRIRYYRKSNGGVSTALNAGLSCMSGKWFAWLSHDDEFAATRIASDMTVLEQHPWARVTYCRSVPMDESGSPGPEAPCKLSQVRSLRDAVALDGMDMCSMTIARECFEHVGLFNESNYTMQDVEMALRLAKVYEFVHNPVGIVYKRDHPSRGTYTQRKQHQEDMRQLGSLLSRTMNFTDYFPNVAPDGPGSSCCWAWLGRFYNTLGATAYAAECYRQSVLVRPTLLGRVSQYARNMPYRMPLRLRNAIRMLIPRR